jgi:hypothetical protein
MWRIYCVVSQVAKQDIALESVSLVVTMCTWVHGRECLLVRGAAFCLAPSSPSRVGSCTASNSTSGRMKISMQKSKSTLRIGVWARLGSVRGQNYAGTRHDNRSFSYSYFATVLSHRRPYAASSHCLIFGRKWLQWRLWLVPVLTRTAVW